MLNHNFFIKILFSIGSLLLILSCQKKVPLIDLEQSQIEIDSISLIKQDTPLYKVVLQKNITIDQYFDFVNDLVTRYDSLVNYPLTEYLLVHANDWLIDTFAQTDYYYQMKKGNFIYNQKDQVILHHQDTLFIPDEKLARLILKKIESFSIDINIPEFKLRILQGDSILFTFPVRVGRVGKRYMSTVGRDVDMKTKTGDGRIYKINRDPRWQNPVNGHEYKTTLRDDRQRTMVPRIPFLFPEINDKKWGQLIHPTTNPETLGRAYSNGCIGTREGDAWIIYFHAPINTKVRIRYDLELEQNGKNILLKDIYHPEKQSKKSLLQ